MRRALAALLLLLALSPAGAQAAPPTLREIVLTGSRSASVEMTFPDRFSPHLGIAHPDGVAATTRGTYAGVWFENVRDARWSQGRVVVPAMGDALPIAWGGSDREDFSLPAGRYRVHLVADGPSTVRVRVGGLARTTRLSPTRPSDVRGRLVKVTAVTADIPVLVKPTTTTVMAASTQNEPSLGAAISMCLDEGRELPCEAGQGFGMTVAFFAPGLWSRTMATYIVYPGTVASGEHTARYKVASGTPTATLYAFALSLL
ncbi:MAG TPA: hypothetical protein VGX28_06400 [Frankiaceae bacterium]|jgi:hypothetical protein|nr:hypothetical protein [Frankiaceae bacterium]